MKILCVVLVEEVGTFHFLYLRSILLENGGILWEFVLKGRDVLNIDLEDR